MLYCGETNAALDDKGRLIVPMSFRRIMDVLNHDTWFITRGYDNSLFMFPHPRWEQVLKTMIPKSSFDPRIMDFRRFFIGGASKSRIDKQGRLLIPQYLREYAGIDRESVLFGMEDHVQMWSNTGWSAFQERRIPDYKDMAAELFGLFGSKPAELTEDTDNADS
jgi:MraZ protein